MTKWQVGDKVLIPGEPSNIPPTAHRKGEIVELLTKGALYVEVESWSMDSSTWLNKHEFTRQFHRVKVRIRMSKAHTEHSGMTLLLRQPREVVDMTPAHDPLGSSEKLFQRFSHKLVLKADKQRVTRVLESLTDLILSRPDFSPDEVLDLICERCDVKEKAVNHTTKHKV